jgi:Aromatic-ring-opening dioxygenase LigAB, LigA subunit
MIDYWLNKLIFDLQAPATMAEFRADRAAVIARYALEPEASAALLNNDITTLVRRGVNPYLVRMYGYVAQVPEDSFVRQIEASSNSEIRNSEIR